MKYRVAGLEGALLDQAVAKAEGLVAIPRQPAGYFYWSDENGFPRSGLYRPSTDWAIGGPFIARKRINLEFMDESGWRASIEEWRDGWMTDHPHETACQYGVTPLIAAMRTYCASKFGEEVELP